MEVPFICFCNQQVRLNEITLRDHILTCQAYQKQSPFYRDFLAMPKERLQLMHLIALKAEFTCFTYQLESLIQQKQQSLQTFQPTLQQAPRQFQSQIVLQSSINNPIDLMRMGRIREEQCYVCIKMCAEQNVCYLECCFLCICRECLIKKINKEYVPFNSEILCPNPQCRRVMQAYFIEQVIGKAKKDLLEQKLIEVQFNLVKCIKCHNQASFEVGNTRNLILKDPITGQLLGEKQLKHYVDNRFTCVNAACKTEQCKGCNAQPYHLGLTCEEYAVKQASKRCRYCDQTIHQLDYNRPPALQDICNQKECVEKLRNACSKMLPCGHACRGFANEQQCLPCLHEACNHSDQKIDDYCNICYVEGLGQSPCIQSACGHIFHYTCISKRLEVKWNGPRIVFTFCFCPLCKQWLQFSPSQPAILLEKYLNLIEDVKKKSLERLKYEGKEKDDRLVKPGDPFFQKPQEYAMAIYCYYQCFKCQKPYFGGAKDCQRALEDDKKEFDPKELVCANCCEVGAGENCNKHGKEYIEFKCKFCCSIAVWFCWGTTHFCEDCHKRQCSGDYVSKYTKDKLPKCLGKDKCPIGGDHIPNGDEQSLGCALCRNAKANAKNF